jgi:hypothetical protein
VSVGSGQLDLGDDAEEIGHFGGQPGEVVLRTSESAGTEASGR